MDLDTSQKETRNASAELFRVKSAYEESVLQLDEVRRENKNLSNEIKDIMDQISEGKYVYNYTNGSAHMQPFFNFCFFEAGINSCFLKYFINLLLPSWILCFLLALLVKHVETI